MLLLILIPLLIVSGSTALWILKKQKRTTVSVYITVPALLFIGFGLFLIIRQLNTLEEYSRLKHWQKTQAIIEKTQIVGQRAIRPQIWYRYRADDSLFAGTSNLETPGFGGRNNRKQTARNILKAYPQGDSVTVYYNPDKPSDSRLKINPPWHIYMKLSFGAFLFLIGSVVDMLWFLDSRK